MGRPQMDNPRMGTRWGRSSGAALVGMGLTAAMSTALWTNAFGLDASLVIQNEAVSFASSKLVASDVGFGMTLIKGEDGQPRNALRAGFAGAKMNGLCVSKTETLAGVGAVTIKLTSGDGDSANTEISAANAAFDVIDLQAKGTGIQLQGSTQIGLSTPDITTVPGTAPFSSNPLGQLNPAFTSGKLENFDAEIWNTTANGGRMNGQGFTGIDATRATLTTVYGKVLNAQIVGSITLPNLKISVTPGTGQSCEAQAIAAGFASGHFPGMT